MGTQVLITKTWYKQMLAGRGFRAHPASPALFRAEQAIE
jgi:hypothetical protein